MPRRGDGGEVMFSRNTVQAAALILAVLAVLAVVGVTSLAALALGYLARA